jgi:hypothetical protein
MSSAVLDSRALGLRKIRRHQKLFGGAVGFGLPIVAGIPFASAGLLQPTSVAITPAGPIASLVAVETRPQIVTPLDTFDIDVVGFTTAGSGAFLAGPFDATFGVTNTYAAAALESQTVTVVSNEVIGLTTTTDTITISVPTSFDPSGTTLGGSPITSMQAEIGGYNAGTDTLDFALPVSGATATGYTVYSTNTQFNLSPQVTLENGGSSAEAVEGLNAGGADLGAYNFHNFTFAISYPTAVPEPTSAAAVLVGIAAVSRRRKRS